MTGYGTQALALKYLGIEFEHWRTCEWAIKSIQAYKDIHFTNETHDSDLTKEEYVDYLFSKGISSNYNEPMTYEQIKRLNDKQLKTIYDNIQTTHNLVNIQQAKGKDLEIVDTDIYDYILTYSFPCQDLSLAGKGKGMSDTSTRSGMLWEVERILTECKELGNLPQVLIMENVPQVHSQDNVQDFNKWQLRLEEFGYKNYWEDLIATDFGIPQTRNRCFMISILGDYNYTFPKPISLKLKLKDMLEENVDDKYFLSDKMINFFKDNETKQKNKGNGFKFNVSDGNTIAKTITTKSGSRMDDNFVEIKNKSLVETLKLNNIKEYSYIDSYNRNVKTNGVIGTVTTRIDASNNSFVVVPEATKKRYVIAKEGDGVYINRPHQKRGVVQKDKIQTLKTSCDDFGVVVKEPKILDDRDIGFNGISLTDNCPTQRATRNGLKVLQTDLRIRKLTPKECFRLMGVKDEDYEKVKKNQSDSSLYHLAGDSIVVNVLMAIFGELFEIEWENKIGY